MKSQVYSVLSGETVEIVYPSSIVPASTPKRRHSGVTVKNSLSGKVETGSIVTHLPLSEWAIANGYQIVDTGRCYKAKPNEITRLF
jgi:hypothetical protein